MYVLENFDKDTRYMFDKNLYKKLCKKLKIKPEEWADICHLKEVYPITEDTGYIKIDNKLYNISCLWCREKELFVNVYTSSDIIEGDEF